MDTMRYLVTESLNSVATRCTPGCNATLPPEYAVRTWVAQVLSVHDVSNIYHVPLLLASQNAAGILMSQLELAPLCKFPEPQLDEWNQLALRVDSFEKVRRVATGKPQEEI